MNNSREENSQLLFNLQKGPRTKTFSEPLGKTDNNKFNTIRQALPPAPLPKHPYIGGMIVAKIQKWRTSLVVQWLRIRASNGAGGWGQVQSPAEELTPQSVMWCGQKLKIKKDRLLRRSRSYNSMLPMQGVQVPNHGQVTRSHMP